MVSEYLRMGHPKISVGHWFPPLSSFKLPYLCHRLCFFLVDAIEAATFMLASHFASNLCWTLRNHQSFSSLNKWKRPWVEDMSSVQNCEQNPLLAPLYWLVNRIAHNGLWSSPIYWIVYKHVYIYKPIYPTNRGFEHCSFLEAVLSSSPRSRFLFSQTPFSQKGQD